MLKENRKLSAARRKLCDLSYCYNEMACNSATKGHLRFGLWYLKLVLSRTKLSFYLSVYFPIARHLFSQNTSDQDL